MTTLDNSFIRSDLPRGTFSAPGKPCSVARKRVRAFFPIVCSLVPVGRPPLAPAASCRLSKLSLLLEAAGTETSASEVKTPRRRQPPVGPGVAAGKHVALEAEKVSKLIVGWDDCDNCVGDPGKVCWDFWDEAWQLSLWQHCLVARHKHGRCSG